MKRYTFKIIEEKKLSGKVRWYVRATVWHFGFFPLSYWVTQYGYLETWLSWSSRHECWCIEAAEHLIREAKDNIGISQKVV